ncbi:hypothetical protein [Komagataeibacter saccharivorans]|uniref:hypothetical protein n=1 Tax=Komagataeibacter saccharivorans TaxID=265959 RepID=UPI0014053D4B
MEQMAYYVKDVPDAIEDSIGQPVGAQDCRTFSTGFQIRTAVFNIQAPERGFILNAHKELNMSGQKQQEARRSVLIIDCQDKGEDPGSEGKFIRHMLNLMGVANHYHSVRTKTQFLELLSSVPTVADVVHIATHGYLRKPPTACRQLSPECGT